MNKVVLEDLANALNKTRLVEGPILQAFLSRVICWRGDTPKQSKIDMNIMEDPDMTASVDPRLREDIFVAEKSCLMKADVPFDGARNAEQPIARR